MHEHVLADILILLTATVVAVAVLRVFKFPPIIGYLTVGMLVGPHGFAWLADAGVIRFMAELGVVFLMFMLGLEISPPGLVAARCAMFGVGAPQVVLTTLLASSAAYIAGLPGPAAVAVGGAVSMSSTAIVLKQLVEQAEIDTRHGRMAVAILLFQDLATLPFLVALPVMAEGSGTALGIVLAWALLKAALVFTIMVFAGRWFTGPLIHWVARTKSAELFMLTTLLMILGAAAVANFAGLSLALGAFLAGMVAGETAFKHQVAAEIRPIQNVLLGLFFVTIGMQLDPVSLGVHWWSVLLLLTAISLGKPLVVTLLVVAARSQPGVALRTGIVLAHCGEFGLLLVSLAIHHGLLEPEAGQIVLTAMVLSMVLAPIMLRWNEFIAKRLDFYGYRENLARQEKRVARAAGDLENHLILCGYGRVGEDLVRSLEVEGLPYVALDLDAERVRKARAAGKRVMYGDAGRLALLEAAGLMRAQALVISFDQPAVALKILYQLRRHRSDLPVLARTMDAADLERLRAAGATEVLPRGLEVSILMRCQLLSLMGVPHSRVEAHMNRVQDEEYCLMHGFVRGNKPASDQESDDYPEELRILRLPKNAYAVGCRLEELDLGCLCVSLVAVRRGGIHVPEPTLDTAFRVDDILVMYGEPEALAQAERVLLAPQEK